MGKRSDSDLDWSWQAIDYDGLVQHVINRMASGSEKTGKARGGEADISCFQGGRLLAMNVSMALLLLFRR